MALQWSSKAWILTPTSSYPVTTCFLLSFFLHNLFSSLSLLHFLFLLYSPSLYLSLNNQETCDPHLLLTIPCYTHNLSFLCRHNLTHLRPSLHSHLPLNLHDYMGNQNKNDQFFLLQVKHKKSDPSMGKLSISELKQRWEE